MAVFAVSEDMAIRRGSFWDLSDDTYATDDDDELGAMMMGGDDDLFGPKMEDNNYNIFVAKVRARVYECVRVHAAGFLGFWGPGGI